MVISRYVCDRCRGAIPHHRSYLRIEAGPLRQHRQDLDLCPDCAADLAAFLSDRSPAPAGHPDLNRAPLGPGASHEH